MDILERLRAEGQRQSQGKFTLDLVRRQEKLLALQSRQPWLFVWKFLQSAVRSRARSFTLETSGERTVIAFQPGLPGDDFGAKMLEGENPEPPWQKHLMWGAILAFASEGRSHQLTIDDGHRRKVMDGQGKQWEGTSQGVLVQLVIENFPRRWWKILAGLSQKLKLREELRQRVGLAPIEVLHNGYSLPVSTTDIAGRPWLCEWLYPNHDGLVWPNRCGVCLRHNDIPASISEQVVCLDTRWMPPIKVAELSGGGRKQPPKVSSALKEIQAELIHGYGEERTVDGYLEFHWQALGIQGADCEPCHRKSRSSVLAPELSSDLTPILFHPRLLGVAQLPLFPKGPARIYPYWDGLCLEPIEVAEGPPGAKVVLHQQDWEVDLGQLQGLPSLKAVAWARQVWAEQMEWLKTFIGSSKQCDQRGHPLEGRLEWRAFLKGWPPR